MNYFTRLEVMASYFWKEKRNVFNKLEDHHVPVYIAHVFISPVPTHIALLFLHHPRVRANIDNLI